jgi:hypothetical protein
MGAKLSAVFARAFAEGGAVVAGKLAFKTRITSQEAAAVPDAAEQIAAATQLLDELLREARAAPKAAPAAAAAAGGGGRIMRYFEFAMEKGGIPAVVKLAGKTGVTRQTAAATPETPDLLAKFREALGAVLPGVPVPQM